MKESTFLFPSVDQKPIYTYYWKPSDERPVRGVVQIAHGMAETAERYRRFAEELTSRGFIVYANDHRGHGLTAATEDDLGYLGEDGFNRMVDDMYELNRLIKDRHPGLKNVLFGHSMGSFLSQHFMSRYGTELSGVILSGSNGKPEPLLPIAQFLAKREVRRHGDRSKSRFLTRLLFGGYNKRFRPTQTDFDWLSRDVDEVRKYIENKYCGNVHSASFFRDMFKGVGETFKDILWRTFPRNVPVLLISGAEDPLGKFGKGVLYLKQRFERYGIYNVTCKLYPGARHELLNETNRDEVTQDVVRWLSTMVESE